MRSYFSYFLTSILACSPILGQETFARSSDHEMNTLKKQISELMKRIDDLERKNSSLPSLSTPGLKMVEHPSSLPPPTTKPIVTSGEKNVNLAISGQVSRALLSAKNGVNSRTMHVDNDNFPTRIRFDGTAKISEDFKAGATLEGVMSSNTSSNVDIGDLSASNGSVALTKRRIEVTFDHQSFGKLWLGQGDTASKDSTFSDLSNTDIVSEAEIGFLAGGIRFVNSNNVKGPRISDVYNGMDGLRRTDRIRYDTPQFYGLSAATSHVMGDMNDIALKFRGEVQKTQIQAAIGYANDRKGSNSKQTSGSLSLLLPIGVSFTLAAGDRSYNTNNRSHGKMIYGKLGYQRQFFNFGQTALAVDMAKGKNILDNTHILNSYGLFFVQMIDKISTDLYVGARNHKLTAAQQNYKNIFTVMTGARVKF